MPQRQHHRGRQQQDAELFGEKWMPALRHATADLSYLLTRGYSDAPALKLVGDHYQLHARQRVALSRAACADHAVERRSAHEVQPSPGARLLIDGYNVLITAETALSQGILIRARDGCIRDIAGIHGAYRKVEETIPALCLIGGTLAELGVGETRWLLDAPVGNSGNLARLIRETAQQHGWPWTAQIEPDPDKILQRSPGIVVTSDSVILDRAEKWLNLTPRLLPRLNNPQIIDLQTP